MQRAGKFFIIGAAAALLVSGVLLSQARRQTDPTSRRPAAAVPLSPATPAGSPAAALASAAARARAATTTRLALEGAPTITVYKTPTCGCCSSWVEHLREHGFEVETHDLNNLDQVKRRHGITRSLESCHTAEVDGYVVEGHVPADLIERMLRERPEIAGLAVPGMPMGSPGMEGHYTERYNVLAFDREGKTTIFDRR
jgi:hypothetical protein